jgi:hypothetical protein
MGSTGLSQKGTVCIYGRNRTANYDENKTKTDQKKAKIVNEEIKYEFTMQEALGCEHDRQRHNIDDRRRGRGRLIFTMVTSWPLRHSHQKTHERGTCVYSWHSGVDRPFLLPMQRDTPTHTEERERETPPVKSALVSGTFGITHARAAAPKPLGAQVSAPARRGRLVPAQPLAESDQ